MASSTFPGQTRRLPEHRDYDLTVPTPDHFVPRCFPGTYLRIKPTRRILRLTPFCVMNLRYRSQQEKPGRMTGHLNPLFLCNDMQKSA